MRRGVDTILTASHRPDRCVRYHTVISTCMCQTLPDGEQNNSTSMSNVIIDYVHIPLIFRRNSHTCVLHAFASPTPPPPSPAPDLVHRLRAQGRDKVRRVFHVELRSVLRHHLRCAHRCHFAATSRIRFLDRNRRSPKQSPFDQEANWCAHAPAILEPGSTDHHQRQRWRWWW